MGSAQKSEHYYDFPCMDFVIGILFATWLKYWKFYLNLPQFKREMVSEVPIFLIHINFIGYINASMMENDIVKYAFY